MHVPLSPKWNRAVDGMDWEESMRQAREFERSFLPRGIVFPREGQIWQAVRDCEVGFLAWFSKAAVAAQHHATPTAQAPFFPCGAARLNRGEQVRILAVDDPKPLSVSFVPVRYAELEQRLVPEHIRSRLGYSHYQLSATTARTFGLDKAADYFTDCFELVQDSAATT